MIYASIFIWTEDEAWTTKGFDYYIEGNAKKSTKSFLVQAEFIRFRQNFEK